MYVLITVLLASLLLSALILFNKRKYFLYALVFILIFQNIAAMISLRTELVRIDNATYLLILKEAMLAFGLMFLILKNPNNFFRLLAKPNAIDILVFLYLLYILALSLLEASIPWLVKMAGVRQLVLLPSLYLLGRLIYWEGFDLKDTVSFLTKIAIFVSISGLIETYIFPENFWILIGQEEYYLAKEGRQIIGTLYGNMYYWDFGKPVRRVASIIGDPLISSYVLLFSFLILTSWMKDFGLKKIRKGHIFVFIILTTLLLTFSRGAIVSLLAGTLIVKLSYNVLFLVVAILSSTIFIVALSITYKDAILTQFTGSSHLEGLYRGLSAGFQNPFGIGIGLSGNTAIGISQATSSLGNLNVTGGDSYLGSVSAQIGIIGAILLYSFLLALIIKLYQIQKNFFLTNDQNPLYDRILTSATLVTLVGIFITSTLNESGTSFVGSGMVFIMSGIVISSLSSSSRKQQVHSS